MNTPALFGRNHATLKMMFVGLLSLAMLIPLYMVRSIVQERQNLQVVAAHTIADRWGGQQTVGGLVALTHAPVRHNQDKASRTQMGWRGTVLSELSIEASLVPEIRYLGIYEVPVYTTRVIMEGIIDWQRLGRIQGQGDLLFWLPLSDVRGVREVSALHVDGLEIPARPLAVHTNSISGLQFKVTAGDRPGIAATGKYRLELLLAGSQSVMFLPLADTSTVKLDADWPDPEFIGQFLPVEHSITDSGVQATWRLLGVNRPYGDQWAVAGMSFQQLGAAGFGMRLETPVDGYQRSERSVKYGFLFISLTFFTLFLFEVMTGRPLHPVPYVLTGAALAVFYLVLLALSEYLPFSAAFALAAGLLVVIVTPYMGAVLGNRRHGYGVGAMMALTYSLLYVLVTAQHAALLLGSLALLTAIAVLMFLTRNVDWYDYGFTGSRIR